MDYLTREEINHAEDHTSTTVEVPEWGGTVRIRTLSGNELESMYAAASAEGHSRLYGPMLVRCLCNEDGGRLYSDEEMDELMDRHAAVLVRLYEEAVRAAVRGAERQAGGGGCLAGCGQFGVEVR